MKGAGAGTAKTLQKLEKSVQAGNYYEAQQMYKTVYSRYMNAGKYIEAIDLLQSGASNQLQHGQVTCGIELGILLIETFGKSHIGFDDSDFDRVKALYHDFPRIPDQTGEHGSTRSSEAYVEAKARVQGLCTFMKAAIKWCIDSGGPSTKLQELHDMLAQYIWTQSPDKDIVKASFHFVRGSHPDKYATALAEYIKLYTKEADLMIARGVFMYLSLGNLKDANRLVDELKQISNGIFPDTPLIHFIKFLLLTLERDALPLFRMLCESYKASIERDPSFNEFLDEIAERFFRVQRKNGLQGMFGDFFKMFMNETAK